MEDTSPEMAEKMREMMQKKTPTERLEMGFSMNETSRYLVTRFILQNNPGISKVDLQKELFLKFYENDFNAPEREKILAHIEKVFKEAS